MSIKVLTKFIHHVIVNMGVFVGKQHTQLDVGIRLMVNIVLQTAPIWHWPASELN